MRAPKVTVHHITTTWAPVETRYVAAVGDTETEVRYLALYVVKHIRIDHVQLDGMRRRCP